jgi:hypothetical protein
MLDVKCNGRIYPVTVPEGGIDQGQIFQAELQSDEDLPLPMLKVTLSQFQ